MQLLIFGMGGLGKELVEIIQSSCSRSHYEEIFILDSRPELTGQTVFGVPIIGDNSKLEQFDPAQTEACIAIANPKRRRELVQLIKGFGFRFASIVDDSALVRPSATVGEGVVIFSHVVIACDAKIGNHVIINSSTIVGHDTIVADYSTISPNTVICGNVYVNQGVEIGSGAMIHPNITIGEWAKVGMGSIIYKSVPPNVLLAAKPARIVSRKAHDWYN